MSTPKSFSIETATWRGHCLALADGLHNVNIALTLPQLQPIVSCAAPCRSVETSDLQELFVRHPSSNSTPQGHSICSQMVPAEIAPANTRPACHHSTSSHPHSSVHHLANYPVPTTSASLNQCARHCHQVARVQQWKLLVTVIHHAQQVQTLCVMWKPRVKQVHSCVEQISPFSCLPHQRLNVTFFHALP